LVVVSTIILRVKRDLYEHFLAINRETSAGGVVV